jgi:hypothetical protein
MMRANIRQILYLIKDMRLFFYYVSPFLLHLRGKT